MKVHVITDAQGNIVGTLHNVPGAQGDTPVAQPQPLHGQKIQQLDLPKELENVRDAERLHAALKPLLKS
jgi:hypothetical protein